MPTVIYGEKRKPVSFNLATERELYELAQRINFSSFVKQQLRLLLLKERDNR